jgi:uncharacterized protein
MIPVRLHPGDDLRAALDALLQERGWPGAFVLSGIGSLSVVQLRLAGRSEPSERVGDLEILTLAGTLSPDGSHLHASVSDAYGEVLGGHVLPGCRVRTTAEVLIAPLDVSLGRTLDPQTGFLELTVGA